MTRRWPLPVVAVGAALLWAGCGSTDIERHEAFLNLAVVKGHRHASVAADVLKLRAA